MSNYLLYVTFYLEDYFGVSRTFSAGNWVAID